MIGMEPMAIADPCLTDAEIERITGLKQPKRQVEMLIELGYPAFLRPDNTVSLGRAQYEHGPMPEKGKIDRPTVQPIPRHGKTKKEPAAAG